MNTRSEHAEKRSATSRGDSKKKSVETASEYVTRRYLAGDRVSDIAADTGINSSAIYRLLSDVPKRPYLGSGAKTKISAEAEDRIVDMYEAGERVVDIAESVNVALGTIYRVLKRAGQAPSRQNRTAP